MMNLAEYRNRQARLADFLPWVALVGAGIVLNKDGSFQRTAGFAVPISIAPCPPNWSRSPAASTTPSASRLRLGDLRRGAAPRRRDLSEQHLPDSASALVDAERKADFEEAGAHFESSYFLTFTYLPPAEDAARAETWLYEGREKTGIDPHEVMTGFADRTDRLLRLIEAFMPECRWLDDGETLTYLHGCVSTPPSRPRPRNADLSRRAARRSAADRRAGAAPWQPASARPDHHRLSDRDHARPARRAEPARLSLSLVHPRHPARQDRRDQAADQDQAAMVRQAQAIAAILKEVMTNEQSVLVDTDASNKAADADLALQELGADYAGIAYVTATVTVWDADPRIADEKLRLVEKVIQGRDFTAMARPSTPWTPGSDPCPAMSTPMSGSRRSPRSISPT
jgi:type IV secretion system protein VirB4